jgi:hypothetical protein
VGAEADLALAELVTLEPDERLLGEDASLLPVAVGRPESLPFSPARRRIVGLGATMTGVTLVGGVALIVAGLAELIAGGSAWLIAVAFVLGVVLIATHWGWVHVAELTANKLEGRRHASLLERRRAWLRTIEPYPRWEVGTATEADGSIAIVTVLYRPVPRAAGPSVARAARASMPSSAGTFTFAREEVGRELHSGDEPGADVAERAELLRRQAAADTARERERYEVAHEAYQRAVAAHADERERVAAVRAASEALSERINANLRDPPLVE